MVRTIVFQREDGTQVLIQVWADNTVTMAERAETWHTWGPPLSPVVDDAWPDIISPDVLAALLEEED